MLAGLLLRRYRSPIPPPITGVGGPGLRWPVMLGPTITAIVPSSVQRFTPGLTLTIQGAAFAWNSMAQLDGVARSTSHVSAIELRVEIPASDLAVPGARRVNVFTPGVGQSNSLALTVVDGAIANVRLLIMLDEL